MSDSERKIMNDQSAEVFKMLNFASDDNAKQSLYALAQLIGAASVQICLDVNRMADATEAANRR